MVDEEEKVEHECLIPRNGHKYTSKTGGIRFCSKSVNHISYFTRFMPSSNLVSQVQLGYISPRLGEVE